MSEISILTSAAGNRMLGYVSPVYYQSKVMQAIFQANGKAIDDLDAWCEEIKLQLFPQTATWGLKYWEDALGLPTNENINLDIRRQRVLSKITTKTPMTPAKMKAIVEQVTALPVDIEENVADYTFRVELHPDGQTPILLGDVIKAVNAAKPSHLSFELAVVYESTIAIKAEVPAPVLFDLAFCGEVICGAYPEPNDATQYSTGIGISGSYSTAAQPFRICGTFFSGDETEFSNDARSYMEDINLSAGYSMALQEYPLCGEIICGEVVV